MSFLRVFQGKLTFGFGMLSGLSVVTSFITRFVSLWLLKGKVYKDNPKTTIEFLEAIDKEIKSIGSEVMKAVIDSMKKRAQDFIQPGGHHLKNVIYDN